MENPENRAPEAAIIPGARAFQKDLAPAYLDHACIVNGYAPPPGSPVGEGMGAGFAYCELYCGSGTTSALLAAANPLGDFHAIDAREQMLEGGKALAEAGKARNVKFHHATMEQAIELSLPQFDYIVLDGVYSWVPLRERAQVLAFVRKFLKPGGVVFVSYNARPGSDRIEPFRRLFLETARGVQTDVKTHLTYTRELYAALHAAKVPAILAGVPPEALKDLDTLPPEALTTDFANPFANPLYVTDVAADFAAVDCQLAGPADMGETLPTLMSHEPYKTLLGRVQTAFARELVKDYLRGTRARRDVLVRGGRRLAADNRDMMMNSLAFVLEIPVASVRYKVRASLGEMVFDNEHAHGIVDLLSKGPRSLGELVQQALAKDADAQAVVVNLHALLITGQVRPVYRPMPEAQASARAMQSAARARAGTASAIGFLPSAVGTAFAVPVPDQLFMQMGASDSADAMADAALKRIAPDAPANSPIRDFVTKRARAYRTNAALYAMLGIST